MAILAFVGSIGAASAQNTPTPIDRLALRGAIACTWLLSDSPRQLEAFEHVRQGMTKVALAQHTGDELTDADRQELNKQLEDLQLTDFERSMLETCIRRETERMLAWINRP